MVIELSNKNILMKIVDFGMSKSRYATINQTKTESSNFFIIHLLNIIFYIFRSRCNWND